MPVSTVNLLVLEIHCAIDTPAERLGHASIWISPAEAYAGPPCDTLEQEGRVRVYGPAPMQEAEAYRDRLSALLSRAGCTEYSGVSRVLRGDVVVERRTPGDSDPVDGESVWIPDAGVHLGFLSALRLCRSRVCGAASEHQ